MQHIVQTDPPTRPLNWDMKMLLDPESSAEDVDHLSFGQHLNFQARIKLWKEHQSEHKAAKFAVLDVGRSVCLDVGGKLSVDHIHTLRINNGLLWLLANTSKEPSQKQLVSE